MSKKEKNTDKASSLMKLLLTLLFKETFKDYIFRLKSDCSDHRMRDLIEMFYIAAF